MECVSQSRDNDSYLLNLRGKVLKQRIPTSGSIELTHRCNLRCVHCYLGPQPVHWSMRNQELGTGRLLSILDEIAEAGCLFLLITGGEPLLRTDFAEIYRRAKNNGLLVTVFTNGTLITDDVMELFEDLPPLCVEITLYGAGTRTYENITGIPGAFERCIQGIERLVAGNVHLILKTMLMTLNSHELLQMKSLADEYGLKFRFDPAISPRLNGDTAPLRLRVPPEEAVEKEFSDPGRLKDWMKYLQNSCGHNHDGALYSCGAGLYHFHINPYGGLQPCMMTPSPGYNLSARPFLPGWRDFIPGLRGLELDPDSACRRCDRMDLCNFCPPSFELESLNGDIQSDYNCALTRHRLTKIQSAAQTGGRK